ncbi:MAG: GAF and ANTAR domain-containing protein [Actinobacteria bacterium]|nr:GAF and ANTAR domain-containing protein [Actinomycetota bacterium]
MVDNERLVQLLGDFARSLIDGYQVTDILYQLCDRSLDILPVTGAGVMLADDEDKLRFVSASDETIREIERAQIALDEGPCLTAYRTGERVLAPDLVHTPWPDFAAAALRAGMKAVQSFPMRVRGTRVGAINFYQFERGSLNASEVMAGQLLADVATAYLVNGRERDERARISGQLQVALDSRVVIEQAKGKVAEQLGVDVGAAFGLLRGHARRHQAKLRTVAEEVVQDRLRLEDG